MLDKIKENLTQIVTLLGVITAIGGGFTVYGEMNEKINSLSGLDLAPIEKQLAGQKTKIAVLEKSIQVLELEIKELKASSKNPLAN